MGRREGTHVGEGAELALTERGEEPLHRFFQRPPLRDLPLRFLGSGVGVGLAFGVWGDYG